MHLAIYAASARTSMRSCIPMPIWSSAYAVTGQKYPADSGRAVPAGSAARCVCAKYGPVGSDESGKDHIIEALGQDKFAALMMNHGAVCLGKTFEEAFIVSDFLEKGAQTAILGGLVG